MFKKISLQCSIEYLCLDPDGEIQETLDYLKAQIKELVIDDTDCLTESVQVTIIKTEQEGNASFIDGEPVFFPVNTDSEEVE